MNVGDKIGVSWGGSYVFIGVVECFNADGSPAIRTDDGRLRCTLPPIDTLKPVFKWRPKIQRSSHV